MALYPLNPGVVPAVYDLSDAISLSSIAGGEVGTLTTRSRSNTSSETSAADVKDGYNYATPGVRAAATLATSASSVPLFLIDEGTSPGYGTMLGQVVGANVGTSLSGTALGPHTATASGKVTCWDKPGLFLVSTDAVASDFITSLLASTSGLAPGVSLGFNASSRLAHSSCSGAVSGSGVAHFVEFESTNSLVTTTAATVGASAVFNRVKIAFHAGLAVRTL